MVNDVWHYPRLELAKQVLGMFESGLSNALVFFAPRRMGKTEFLLKDILPVAEKHGWKVLYFSFLDTGNHAKEAFTLALVDFSVKIGASRWDKFQKRIKKLSAGAVGFEASIEFKDTQQAKLTLKEVIADLVDYHPKILLLLDEVQVLSRDTANQDFVAALRTVLDINKDKLKVIFTGSSREGLRKMFSKSDAPFFHFGQNLPFPEFDEGFIEHLTQIFYQATKRKIDSKNLWDIFIEMNKVPQLIRSLVERMILQPNLSLNQAKEQLLGDLVEDRAYISIWEKFTALEKLILISIVSEKKELFSEAQRIKFAAKMGVNTLSVSTMQSAIRTLLKKQVLGSLPERGGYYIDDPSFKSWIEQHCISEG